MAKPSPNPNADDRLLVLELWGIGDLALAMPFLQTATAHAPVTLVAKPHAAPLLQRFAPAVEHLPFTAPWTAFSGKYRLHRWPWSELRTLLRELRSRRFACGVSARRDPRDHALLAFARARQRTGFPRAGSHAVLTHPLPDPAEPHRAAYWRALATSLGWSLAGPAIAPTRRRPPGAQPRIVIHTGAGHAVRHWPPARFDELAARLRATGYEVTILDDTLRDLNALITTLAAADRFIGNDSGPGHLAALLGVPTFTIFGPQLPELFAPQHPSAAWVTGAPCRYKPCFDSCRFVEPYCLTRLPVQDVWPRIQAWLTARPGEAAPVSR